MILEPVPFEPAPPQGPPPTFLERIGLSPVVFAILCLLGLFFLYQVVGGVVSFFLFGLTPTPENVGGLRLMTALSQILLLFAPTLLLVRLATHSPRTYFRMRRPTMLQALLAVVGILALQQVLQIYLVFQSRIPLPDDLARLLEQYRTLIEESLKLLVSADSIGELAWVMTVIALVPAIVEEFLFRGLIQSSLERGSSPMRAAVTTGVIFGAYHLVPSSFVPLALLGIYLGYLACRSGSLWVAVIAHFCNNAAACIATYLHVDDDAVITGDPKMMSTGVLLGTLWFFGVIFFLTVFAFQRATRPDASDGEHGAGEDDAPGQDEL